MRSIQASLTLFVLLIGLAMSTADAAEKRPVGIDSACGVAHDELLGADFHPGTGPAFELVEPFDSLILSLPLLADTSPNALLPSLDSQMPALTFLVQGSSAPVIRECQCPAGPPLTAAARLTWLQRFLF